MFEHQESSGIGLNQKESAMSSQQTGKNSDKKQIISASSSSRKEWASSATNNHNKLSSLSIADLSIDNTKKRVSQLDSGLNVEDIESGSVTFEDKERW